MKITINAKNEIVSENTITIEKLENGDFKLIAADEFYGESIEMMFSQNGFNALIGSMMAVSGEVFKK